MEQLSLFSSTSYSVSEITRYLRNLLERDPILHDIWIHGEISNLSKPSSGHIYFTLKDEAATLRCVIWRGTNILQKDLLGEGSAVDAHGYISIYDLGGQYQLYIDNIRLKGEGDLFIEFLRLKAKLETDGLFSSERKRLIPSSPKIIGVVTSPTGAAFQDIITIIQRRYPIVTVVIAPTSVQGADAPAGIINALRGLNNYVHPDVIILARGGGSIEDLWAFNDEKVAYAIAGSEAPVISGIGHEVDFTIADFVADMRAPTPTAAAELVTPNKDELQASLSGQKRQLVNQINGQLQTYRLELLSKNTQLNYVSPILRIRNYRQLIDERSRLLGNIMNHKIELDKAKLDSIQQKLSVINPHSILDRGYAIITNRVGEVVKSVKQVQIKDELTVRVSDGEFKAEVSDNHG